MCFQSLLSTNYKNQQKKNLKAGKIASCVIRRERQKQKICNKKLLLCCVFFFCCQKNFHAALECHQHSRLASTTCVIWLWRHNSVVEELKQRECRFDVSGTWVVTSQLWGSFWNFDWCFLVSFSCFEKGKVILAQT